MHDPLAVAFTIRRPWPRRTDCGTSTVRWSFKGSFWRLNGATWWWPSMVTIWHREPGGRDSGEVCKHYRRDQDSDGTWHTTILSGWRWHVRHWKVQVEPLQHLRRWLLTRCTWCGGRSTGDRGGAVSTSHQWNGPRGRWWQGEPGLYHSDCSMVKHARGGCCCAEPTGGDRWKACTTCGLGRYGDGSPERIAQARLLLAVPVGERPCRDLVAEHAAIGRAIEAARRRARTTGDG